MFCKNCGVKQSDDTKFCAHCGTPAIKAATEGAPVMQSAGALKQEDISNLKGVAGWLVLVIINLFVVLGYQLYTVYSDAQLFFNGTVANLSNPSSDVYLLGYERLLILELLMATLLGVAASYLIFLFFKRDRKFPKYYILFLAFSVAYVVIDYGLLSALVVSVDAKKAIEDLLSEQTTTIARSLISAVVWGLYMKQSKRVKATFIEN